MKGENEKLQKDILGHEDGKKKLNNNDIHIVQQTNSITTLDSEPSIP
jgi:hypothetical protein